MPAHLGTLLAIGRSTTALMRSRWWWALFREIKEEGEARGTFAKQSPPSPWSRPEQQRRKPRNTSTCRCSIA